MAGGIAPPQDSRRQALVGTSPKNPQHEALVEGFHPVAFSKAGEDLSQPKRRSRAAVGPPPSPGCSPAVEYPTYGLDKTERNWERVNWSGPCGGGKLKAEGSLVLFQARPSSVVPGPVTKSVMTPGLGDVWRLGRSRLGEYSLCTARAVAPWLTSREECGHGAKAKEC
jgi:hypothetical protein